MINVQPFIEKLDTVNIYMDYFITATIYNLTYGNAKYGLDIFDETGYLMHANRLTVKSFEEWTEINTQHENH